MLKTDLIGKVVIPRYPDLIGKATGPWPVNEPNAAGEHLATVHAVYVDGDNGLKLLVVTPFGTSFETYAQNVKFTTI